ncbi:uncharacterized protein LOC130744037 [Lotus japonicus]|uniref:uncharacterized protein LOC130744037 n=1 Tax=Lotus japonicus TaxID=34305 RepID=UPI00258A73C7|nr:uncharacterized protein LOC130744037 [Lotus japonicus]
MGGNGNLTSLTLPILTENNRDRWVVRMKTLFGFQDVLDVVENGFSVPGDNASEARKATHKEMKKKDTKALFLLQQCVDDPHFEKITNAETSKAAWDSLLKSHAGGEKMKKAKLQTLCRQFELLQIKDSGKISEYFTKVLTLTNLMKGYGEIVTDLMIVEKILISLSSIFDFVVALIEESKELSDMKIEELQSSLEAHEMRLNDINPGKGAEQALKSSLHKDNDKKKGKKLMDKKESYKGRWNQNQDKGDSDKAESLERREGLGKNYGKKKQFDKRNIECFNCYKKGHYSYEFPAGKSKQKKHKEKEAHVAQEDSDSDSLILMATTIERIGSFSLEL